MIVTTTSRCISRLLGPLGGCRFLLLGGRILLRRRRLRIEGTVCVRVCVCVCVCV